MRPLSTRAGFLAIATSLFALICMAAEAQTVTALAPNTLSNPIPTHQTVTWTATVTGGIAPLTFQFWRFDEAGGWLLVQDYSTNASYAWTPTSADAGVHALQVWVRNAGSTSPYDAWLGTGFFSVGASLTLEPRDPGPIVAGSTITWTAHATGLFSPEYLFWRFDATGWELVQSGTNPTYTWSTTPSDRGDHVLQVWARTASTAAQYDVWAGTEFFSVVDSNPIAVSSPVPAAGFPVLAGVPATFTAPATGGIQPLEYKFWRFDAHTAAWTMVQDYGPRSTYTWWTPGTRDIGVHALQVWVRSLGSTAAYDAWAGTGYFEVECPPHLTVTAYDNFYVSDRPPSSTCTPPSCALSGTAVIGTPVTITAESCATSDPLEYQFWRTKVMETGWDIVQGYSGTNTFTWTPTAAEAGLYVIETRARQVGSTSAYETYDTKEFQLRQPAADLAIEVTSLPITAPVGATITVTDTVTNIGPAPSPASTNNYIIDAVLGSRSIPPLAPGQSHSAAVTLTLPAIAGAYYLRVENNNQPDLNFGNNRRFIAVRLLRDESPLAPD